MGFYDLRRFSLHDMTACSSRLRQVAHAATSFPEAANAVVRFLYEHLLDGQSGEPACALVRCFKTQPYAGLPRDQQHLVVQALDGAEPSAALQCLSLVASVGVKPEWNDPSVSRQYGAIPLAGERFVAQFPMFSQLFLQLGIPMQNVSHAGDVLIGRPEQTYNVFFIPDAVASPYVPVQQDFVVPYGIRSVLGFGGMLPSRDVFVVVLFSTVPVGRQTADFFKTLALSAKLALLPFDRSSTPAGTSAVSCLMESESQTLTQLLAVHEEAVSSYAVRGKLAQDALVDTQAKLAAVVKTSRDAVIFVDAQGLIRSWPPAAEAMFGYAVKEVFGKPATQVLAPASHAEFRQMVAQGFGVPPASLAATTVELQGVRKDGHVFPIEMMIATMRPKGSPFYVVMFHDIEERKSAAERLAGSEAHLRSLVEHAPDIIVTLGLDMRITSLNPAFEAVTRWRIEDWLGRSFMALLHADDLSAAQELFDYVVTHRASVTSTLRMHSKDRGLITGEFVGSPHIEDGRVIGLLGIARDVTERKLFEEALRESEERLRAVLQSTTDAIVTADGNGDVVFWNDGAKRLFGYTQEEILGHSVCTIVPARYREAHRRGMAQATVAGKLAGKRDVFEFTGLRKDGSEFPLELTLASWRGRSGTFLTSVIRDITDRKRTEAALRESEERYALAVQGTNDGIWDWHIRDGWMYFSPRFKALLGYDPHELPDDVQAFFDRLHPEDRTFVRQSLDQHLAQRTPYHVEFRLLHKDGSYRWFTSRGQAIWDAAGQPIRMAGALTDITERKVAEEERERLARHLRLLLESAGEGVYGVDTEGRCTFINAAACRMLGYRAEDLVGRVTHDIFHAYRPDGTAYPREECFLFRATTTGVPVDGDDDVLTRKDGTSFPIHYSSSPIVEDGKVQGAVVVFNDISERKKAEEALKAREARLAQAQAIAHLGSYEIPTDAHTPLVWSREVYRILGRDPSTPPLTPLQYRELVVHPDDREQVERVVHRARTQGVPYHVEFRIRRPDRSIRWVESIAEPVYQGDNLVKLVGTVRDITERKQAEAAMNELVQGTASVTGREFFPVFVRHLSAALGVRYAFVVEVVTEEPLRLRAIAGWGGDALIEPFDFDPVGMPCEVAARQSMAFFPSNLQAQFLHPILEQWGAVSYASVGLRDSANRNLGHLCVLHSAPLEEQQRVLQVLSIFAARAVAEMERVRTEGALRQAEARYRSIFEHAVEGIFQTTLDGRYLTVNPALVRLLGYDSPEDMTLTVTDIATQVYVDPERRHEFIRIMQAQGEVTGFESEVRRKDGSLIWISENGRALRDDAGAIIGYEGTVEDITERRRAEWRLTETLKRIRTLSARLEKVREEERARIARELHDELGVGLTCLKIDLSRLRTMATESDGVAKRLEIDDKVVSMIEFVDQTIRSVQRLVVELRPGILDDLGLVAAIEWQSQDFERRTGIACRFHVNKDDFHLDGEVATVVFRICQEALTNVARHAKATAVQIALEQHESHIFLEVSDNGRGIGDEKLGDPHSLGLLGMRERAELFGGSLNVHGRPGKGTTVALLIPMIMNIHGTVVRHDENSAR